MKPITINDEEELGLILMGLEHVSTRYATKLKKAEAEGKTDEVDKLKKQLAGASKLYNRFSLTKVGNAKVARP